MRCARSSSRSRADTGSRTHSCPRAAPRHPHRSVPETASPTRPDPHNAVRPCSTAYRTAPARRRQAFRFTGTPAEEPDRVTLLMFRASTPRCTSRARSLWRSTLRDELRRVEEVREGEEDAAASKLVTAGASSPSVGQVRADPPSERSRRRLVRHTLRERDPTQPPSTASHGTTIPPHTIATARAADNTAIARSCQGASKNRVRSVRVSPPASVRTQVAR